MENQILNTSSATDIQTVQATNDIQELPGNGNNAKSPLPKPRPADRTQVRTRHFGILSRRKPERDVASTSSGWRNAIDAARCQAIHSGSSTQMRGILKQAIHNIKCVVCQSFLNNKRSVQRWSQSQFLDMSSSINECLALHLELRTPHYLRKGARCWSADHAVFGVVPPAVCRLCVLVLTWCGLRRAVLAQCNNSNQLQGLHSTGDVLSMCPSFRRMFITLPGSAVQLLTELSMTGRVTRLTRKKRFCCIKLCRQRVWFRRWERSVILSQ